MIVFKCHHNGCADKGWADLRKLYEPNRKAAAAKETKHNQATALVEVLNDAAKFFHDGDTCFASFDVGDHRETHAITSKAFRQYATRAYYLQRGTVPSSENTTSALNVLAAQARAVGKEHKVYLRTARHDGITYVDIGDSEWRVIKITADGREIVSASDCPVLFRRCKGTMALPEPESGGDISELRAYVNLAADDEAAFVLLVCFMVAVLLGVGPYPILLLVAEQGATKSTLLRILRRLLDPSRLPNPFFAQGTKRLCDRLRQQSHDRIRQRFAPAEMAERFDVHCRNRRWLWRSHAL